MQDSWWYSTFRTEFEFRLDPLARFVRVQPLWDPSTGALTAPRGNPGIRSKHVVDALE
jgi:hypothetical protein